MVKYAIVLQSFLLLLISPLVLADKSVLYVSSTPQPSSSQHSQAESPPAVDTSISYSLNQLPVSNIVLQGAKRQKQRLTRWLNEIALVPKGYATLQTIANSGHTLTIRHSEAARLSSGRTIAPMTRNITNGKGESVSIIFDADMEDRGTHRVFGLRNELIEFNALQNLYHELAHAMHQMQGTWRYFASEKQAIEEENQFRIDLADINGEKPRLRYHTNGVSITSVASGGLGYTINQ